MSDTLSKLQESLRYARFVIRNTPDEVERAAMQAMADALVGGIEALGGTVQDEDEAAEAAWRERLLCIQELCIKRGVAVPIEALEDIVDAVDEYEDAYGVGILFTPDDEQRPEIDNEE